MNKVLKILIATFGGTHLIFSAFIPALVGILIVYTYGLSGFDKYVVLIPAYMAMIYRASEVLVELVAEK